MKIRKKEKRVKMISLTLKTFPKIKIYAITTLNSEELTVLVN